MPGRTIVREVLRVLTGEADIDDSAGTESNWTTLLTIAPATGAPLSDVTVHLDLAKATTGFAAVESTATIQFRVERKIDGTNWHGDVGAPVPASAVSGTNAASGTVSIPVGYVGVNEQARIALKMSADATADMELPYAIYYRGTAAPTITAVAA